MNNYENTKKIITLILTLVILNSCATIFGGRIQDSQIAQRDAIKKYGLSKAHNHQTIAIRDLALDGDCFLLIAFLVPGLIAIWIDYKDAAIFKPIKTASQQK